MTHQELVAEAVKCLANVFKGDHTVPSHVVQAAVSVLLTPEPK
jgi:hypothetical protein